MLQVTLNFTKEEFEELKLNIDEVLEGTYEGLKFNDPSSGQHIIFALVASKEEEENIEAVKRALASGVDQTEIAFVRATYAADITGLSFAALLDDFVKFSSTYKKDNAE